MVSSSIVDKFDFKLACPYDLSERLYAYLLLFKNNFISYRHNFHVAFWSTSYSKIDLKFRKFTYFRLRIYFKLKIHKRSGKNHHKSPISIFDRRQTSIGYTSYIAQACQREYKNDCVILTCKVGCYEYQTKIYKIFYSK